MTCSATRGQHGLVHWSKGEASADLPRRPDHPRGSERERNKGKNRERKLRREREIWEDKERKEKNLKGGILTCREMAWASQIV